MATLTKYPFLVSLVLTNGILEQIGEDAGPLLQAGRAAYAPQALFTLSRCTFAKENNASRAEGKDLRLEREQAAFRGTPRYASITALSMKEQSRKDDLESWWYMIVELMVGRLPWQDLQPNQLEEMKHMKKQVRLKQNLKI
ncbi:hypothetical protein Y032_1192g3741, partial [Ancylostoma ceylanicum]